MRFSLEVTPKVDVRDLPNSIRDVSITFLPGADYGDVVNQARVLRNKGFNPVPHVAARSLQDRQQLQTFVQRLRDEASVQQVFVIGGDRSPLGYYTSTLQLLETGLLEGLKIGVAGHPEGTPHLSPADCDAVLRLKNEYAQATGTEMYIVTQWTLDPQAIIAWLEQIQAFNTLPVRIGIPGPTSVASLMKFAAICGVNASLSALSRQPQKLAQLVTVQTPDALLAALQPYANEFHIFPFGGLKRTSEWLQSRSTPEGDRVLVSQG